MPSRKEWDISVPHLANTTTDPENFETVSQSSGKSTSSAVSIITRIEDSANITSRTLDLAITSCLDSSPEEGFPESRVQDQFQQSSVDQSSTEGFTEDKTVNQMAMSEAKLQNSLPKSPGSNDSASKNTANTEENQDNFDQRESVFPSFALDLAQQVYKNCPDTQRENAGTNQRKLSHSREQEHAQGTNCPLFPPQLHKAMLVETHVREEYKDREEGENLKSITEDSQKGLQADMALVLAIPVTVISEDSDAQGTMDSRSDTLSSMECLQQLGSSQDTHTNGSSPRYESKPNSLQDKHTPREVCVTRKTVNLPSKHKVIPQKVHGNQVQTLAQEKPTKQESRELPLKMLKTTKEQL